MNTPNLEKPAYALRPTMRVKSLSERIQTAQANATRKPAKITLAMPDRECKSRFEFGKWVSRDGNTTILWSKDWGDRK